jgi:hypothetical protein
MARHRIDPAIEAVVHDAYEAPRSVQSDWARKNAQEVAAAASLGLITTVHRSAFGRLWRPTAAGLVLVERATP